MINNLFDETDFRLVRIGKTWDDISWIGGKDFYITVPQFIEAAKETNYDCGYGSEEVATDLIIYFNDESWLSRDSYDGAEFWRYNVYPQKPQTHFQGNIKLADPGGYDAYYGLKKLNE